MVSRFFKSLFICTLLALGFSTGIGSAAEVSKPEISIAPFLQSVEVGSTQPDKTFSVTLTNDSKQTQDLSLSIADFGTLDKTGGVAFVGNEFGGKAEKYQLSPWLALDQASVKLEPGKKITIKATIKNNADLAPGGHYAAIVATVVTPEGKNKTQVNVKQKISSLVFATKTGGEKYDLRLENVGSDGYWMRLPSEAYITVKATGNTHVVPRGIVYLKDKSGKVIKKGAINTESGHILPESSRTFTVPLDKIDSPHFWQRNFYLQIDYRYDGYPNYASQTVKLTYFNLPTYLVLGLVLGVGGWMTMNYLSYYEAQWAKKLRKSTMKSKNKTKSKSKK